MRFPVTNGSSEPLHPGPQFDLPAPRTARLAQNAQVAERNGVRIEQRVGLVRIVGSSGAANRAVDDEVRNMDSLRRQFAGETLGESAQCELAHRERRRLRVSLHARRSAGEQDCTCLLYTSDAADEEDSVD